ncbi:MAG: TetR/AcrR family transcriptional regulator [Flavobacteriales bacterium]
MRCSEVFMRFGIKSVNMDDLARHLGVSKKTLYKHVKDKNDLVLKTFQYHQTIEDETIEAICAKNMNAIDESFEVMKFIHQMLKGLHPSIMYDIEKYHPEVCKSMMDKQHSSIYRVLLSNMTKGQAEGLYRDDFNPEVVAKIYIASVDAIFDFNMFPVEGTSRSELYLEIFRYHIRGIASMKGVEYLMEKVKQEKK